MRKPMKPPVVGLACPGLAVALAVGLATGSAGDVLMPQSYQRRLGTENALIDIVVPSAA